MKLAVELPANVYRDLVAYGEALSQGGKAIESVKLIAPMLARFMGVDRAFARMRRLAS